MAAGKVIAGSDARFLSGADAHGRFQRKPNSTVVESSYPGCKQHCAFGGKRFKPGNLSFCWSEWKGESDQSGLHGSGLGRADECLLSSAEFGGARAVQQLRQHQSTEAF